MALYFSFFVCLFCCKMYVLVYLQFVLCGGPGGGDSHLFPSLRCNCFCVVSPSALRPNMVELVASSWDFQISKTMEPVDLNISQWAIPLPSGSRPLLLQPAGAADFNVTELAVPGQRPTSGAPSRRSSTPPTAEGWRKEDKTLFPPITVGNVEESLWWMFMSNFMQLCVLLLFWFD